MWYVKKISWDCGDIRNDINDIKKMWYTTWSFTIPWFLNNLDHQDPILNGHVVYHIFRHKSLPEAYNSYNNRYGSIWGVPKLGNTPPNSWICSGKSPQKWMIWGYYRFRTPPNYWNSAILRGHPTFRHSKLSPERLEWRFTWLAMFAQAQCIKMIQQLKKLNT